MYYYYKASKRHVFLVGGDTTFSSQALLGDALFFVLAPFVRFRVYLRLKYHVVILADSIHCNNVLDTRESVQCD
jgi:hypothetical protein